MEEAKDLEATVEKTGLLFGLTHNYTGYPMVKEARERVRCEASSGRIRRVVAEYPQGWLATRLEVDRTKASFEWRADPERVPARAAAWGTSVPTPPTSPSTSPGFAIEEISAELSTFVDGRTLDDDASVLLRLADGARGDAVGELRSRSTRRTGSTCVCMERRGASNGTKKSRIRS